MKKRSITITALLLTFAMLAGCSEKAPSPAAPTPTQEAEETITPTPPLTTPDTPTPTPTPTPAKFIPGDATYTTTYEFPKAEYSPEAEIRQPGLVAYATDEGVLISWRHLPGDEDRTYILRKLRNGGGIEKILYKGTATNYLDPEGYAGVVYDLYVVKDITNVGKRQIGF